MRETLDSVKNQPYENWECLVVDDGSVDDSKAIVESYARADARFKSFTRPDNLPKGANACRNYGVEQSDSELLLFLDADDLLSEHCIQNRIAAYEGEDLIIFPTGNFERNVGQATPFHAQLNPDLTAEQFRNQFLNYSIPWNVSSGLWSQTFFKEIGGFDVNLLRFQDVDLHVRALNNPSIRLKIDNSTGFTAFYRKSAFHQKVTLAKRKFILNQGLVYASKMKSLLSPVVFANMEGLFVYLLFRFEEVIYTAELKEIEDLVQTNRPAQKEGFNSFELNSLLKLYRSFLRKPSRFRKYLSFGIYKKYQFSSKKVATI